MKKYPDLCPKFKQFVIESTGGWHNYSMDYLKSIAGHIASRSNKSNISVLNNLLSICSFALQRNQSVGSDGTRSNKNAFFTNLLMLVLVLAMILIKAADPCDCLVRQFSSKPILENTDDPVILEPRRLFDTDERKAKRLQRKARYIGLLPKQEALALCKRIVSHSLFFEKHDGGETEEEDICTICILANDETSIKSLNCGHIFHVQCLKECILLLRTTGLEVVICI
jgi:hypothetical protein